MKILFVFDRPIYPVRGGAEARAVQHLDYLQSRQIDFDLFLIDRYSNYEQWTLHGLELLLMKNPKKIFIHGVLGRSFDVLYRKIISAMYKISQKIPSVSSPIHQLPEMIYSFLNVIVHNEYDYIFFNHTYASYPFVKSIKKKIKTVIDTHDIYSQLIQQIILLKKDKLGSLDSGIKLQSILTNIHLSGSGFKFLSTNFSSDVKKSFDYEKSLKKEIEILSLFDKILTISQTDLDLLTECNIPSNKTQLIPVITQLKPYKLQNNLHLKKRDSFKLLFFGSKYDPNIHGVTRFCSEILPLLDSTFELILAGGVSFSITTNDPRVKSLGYISNLCELYESVDAVILPIYYGSGVSIKAVEALSYGKPIVTTEKGIRGLPLTHNKEVLIAQSNEDFVNLIQLLKSDDSLSHCLSLNAINYIIQNHNQDNIYKALDSIFI